MSTSPRSRSRRATTSPSPTRRAVPEPWDTARLRARAGVLALGLAALGCGGGGDASAPDGADAHDALATDARPWDDGAPSPDGAPPVDGAAGADAQVRPADYYVATTGSDDHDGRTLATAFRTLAKAASVVAAGDVVQVRAGTYAEYVEIDASGAPGAPIVFEPYAGEAVVIDGAGIAPDPDEAWSFPPQLDVRGNDVVVRGFELVHAASLGILVSAPRVVIDSVHVHDGYLIGIRFEATTDGQVLDSRVHGFYDHAAGGTGGGGNADGIDMDGGGGGHLLRGNVVYDTSDDGIDTWSSTNNVIVGNVVHHCGRADGDGNGFKLGHGGGNLVHGNVAYANRADGFNTNDGAGNVIVNNTAYANGDNNFAAYTVVNTFRNNLSVAPGGGDGMWGPTVHDHNSFDLDLGDPQLLSTDPASPDFLRLGPGSPAIDAGVDVGLPFLGTAPDLGAFERS